MSSQKHFTHLHLHTEYSLLDGAIRIKDLMRHAQEQEWKAIGMSDHGNIFGAVKFFEEAKKANLKPVLGCEMYLTPDVSIKDSSQKYHHLIVIVQNKEGYQNLCRLLAYSYQEGFYFKPRIDYKALEKYHRGLIISTACVGGHIPSLLRHDRHDEAIKYMKLCREIFGKDRFYFELMPADIEKQIIVNRELIKYSKEYDINCIVTGDAHYLSEQDHEAHEVLLAIQTKHLMSDEKRMTFGDFKGYVKSTEFMLNEFPEQHDAIWNTGQIADSCDFDFETDKLFFPKYPIPKKYTQEEYFVYLCQQGLEKLRDQALIPADQYELYQERLKIETDLIIEMGFTGYFLITSDFILWAKEQNIPVGPGRGSAAGSLVAWAMSITNVDPIKYNLLFERFLNPERVSMPDIDIDFCIEGREKVINYVKEKYGHENVCQIITFGTMMAKGVIKDVARTLGFPFQDANNLTNLVPDQLKISLNECLEQEPQFNQLINSNPEIKHLMDICFRLEGLTRHASKHAAGVVISPEPLKDVLPLYIPPKTTELVTQYAMTELETLGFLKMDFLGLKNLTIINQTLQSIEQNHGKKIDLDRLPFDDKKTFELLAMGKTSGVFQFESSGIKDVLFKLQPSRFEDLIAVNALYRPGPLGSGMVDDFIDRRHGRKKTTYMFPELEPILSETYGVIVYQEQVMKIASTIAGYSLGAADILRRAMGKKKVEVMAEQKKMFLEGAAKKGFDQKKAAELFDLMAYFAGYGFNKSHSTAYALIAYHTAYLKAHYPKEFMASVLSFETNDPDKLKFYLQEVHDMGIETLKPDINTSHVEFIAQPDGILFGLKGIKNVGGAALELIVSEREKEQFSDLYNFCKKIDMRTVNKRIIESLICAGAFDTLPGYRSQQMAELETIMKLAHDEKEREKTGQLDMFAVTKPKGSSSSYSFTPQPEWSDQEKLEKEREVVGFYLSAHPLDSYRSVIKALRPRLYKEILQYISEPETRPQTEPHVITCGLLQTHKVITTRKGDKMAFATFEDHSGGSEVIIFPRVFRQVEGLLHEHNLFIVTGNVDLESQQMCKIKADQLIPLDTLFETQSVQAIQLVLPENYGSENISHLEAILPAGRLPVQITFKENGHQVILNPQKKIALSHELLRNLNKKHVKINLQL